MADQDPSGAKRAVAEPEALVRRFWRTVFDERDLSAAPALLAPDVAWRGSLGAETAGLDGFLAYARAAQAAMPDLTVALDEVACVGPQVWTRMTFRATHAGELLGVLGSGRPVSYVGQAVHDTRDGVLTRVWVVGDTLSLYRQLVGG